MRSSVKTPLSGPLDAEADGAATRGAADSVPGSHGRLHRADVDFAARVSDRVARGEGACRRARRIAYAQPRTIATPVRNGMSSAAAVRAASAPGAHGRSLQPSLPNVQIAAASNSLPHSQSATRLKRAGAFTVGRNSQAPNVIHTVRAVASSMVRWSQTAQRLNDSKAPS